MRYELYETISEEYLQWDFMRPHSGCLFREIKGPSCFGLGGFGVKDAFVTDLGSKL